MSKIKYIQLGDKQWLEEQLKTKSIHLVSKDIGCSYSAVIYAIKKLSIKVIGGVKERRLNKDRSKNVSIALNKKYPNGRFGELAANWRGGKRRCGTKMAYVAVLSHGHPFSDGDGYVMEHRLVMEKHLGRLLDPKEIVHHKNGIKHDNRLENLELVESRGTHTKEHFKRSHITEQLWNIVNSCNHCKPLAQNLKL